MYYRKRHGLKIYAAVQKESHVDILERVMLDEIGQVGVRLSDDEAARVRRRFSEEVDNGK